MGRRLYVAKKYVVEWSDFSAFNWKLCEFKTLMSALEVNCEGDLYDSPFEVSKDEWKEGIRKLENFDFLEEWNKKEIENALNKLEYTREDVIEAMKKFLKEADKDREWIHFDFF